MPDIEDQDCDDQHEQVCAHNRRGSKQRNSAISSEGEASSQHRTPSFRGRPGLSLSKSLRRRYLLVLGLLIGGVMLAIVVLGVMSAIPDGDEDIDIRMSNVTGLPFDLTTEVTVLNDVSVDATTPSELSETSHHTPGE